MSVPNTDTAARPVFTDIGRALGTDYFLLKSELTNSEPQYSSALGDLFRTK